MFNFVEMHSGELTIFFLVALVAGSLIVLVPQILRMNLQKAEMLHNQNMRALEKGVPIQPVEARLYVAGRMAVVVPSVVMIAAGTVTCFLGMRGSENVFSVSLAVWVVGGVVSLAAIIGGMSFGGRIQNMEIDSDDEFQENSF